MAATSSTSRPRLLGGEAEAGGHPQQRHSRGPPPRLPIDISRLRLPLVRPASGPWPRSGTRSMRGPSALVMRSRALPKKVRQVEVLQGWQGAGVRQLGSGSPVRQRRARFESGEEGRSRNTSMRESRRCTPSDGKGKGELGLHVSAHSSARGGLDRTPAASSRRTSASPLGPESATAA